jgi:X-linked retinitis pigmentosa GTPase regulator
MNFSLDDTTGFAASAELVEVTKTYVPAAEPQFALADVEAFELEYAKKKKGEKEEDEDEKKPEDGDDESKKPEDKKSGEEDDEDDSSDDDDADDDDEEKKKKKKTKFKKDEKDDDEDKCPKCGKPKSECTCEDEDDDDNKGKKSKYNLDEIEEYVELSQKYSALESDYNAMKAEMATLVEFKKSIEKKDKEAMIASFYMLSDEEKKDVIDNIDTYSLEDIEAKLSIICVRNKVNFNLDEDNKETTKPTTFSLDGSLGDDNVPAWVKSLRNVAKSMN